MLFLRAGHFVSWEAFTETWSLLFRLDSLSSRLTGSTCHHLSWQRSLYHDPFVFDMSSALELRSSCLQRPGLSFPAPLFMFVHLSASFEAVSFCIPGWFQTHHVSASAPWVWGSLQIYQAIPNFTFHLLFFPAETGLHPPRVQCGWNASVPYSFELSVGFISIPRS